MKKQLEALKEATAAQPQEKAPKEIAAEAQDDSTASLQADTRTELKQALKAAEKATTLHDKVAADMFQYPLFIRILIQNIKDMSGISTCPKTFIQLDSPWVPS